MATTYLYHGDDAFLAAVQPRLEQAGFQRVADKAEASILVSFCTSSSHLEDLYFGEGGLVQDAPAGALLIDLSATTPSFARELNAVATVSDIPLIEAPFVVRDLTASSALDRGNLSCYVAGDADSERARPFLDALFGTVKVVGAPGSAQLLRAARTLQTTAYLISVIEADALYHAQHRTAAGAGVDEGALEVESPDARRIIEAVHDGRFAGQYTVEMLMAALSSAIMAADDAELIMPQAEAALHLLELLCVIGGSDLAPTALALVYGEEGAGAAAGLDWDRAEQLYRDVPAEEADPSLAYDDEGYDGFDGGFDYSSN